ncbi:hypothetical protein GQ44DRAFT_254430 [Phaeosphaeriaceae sp. PMI808]|nr:hypothetical protein GQ44DRAFT_254430 [Phaeosphaeriaceae sp. PMI808]
MVRTPLAQLTPSNINSQRSLNVQTGRKKRSIEDSFDTSCPYKLNPPRKRIKVVLSTRRKREIIEYFLRHRIEEPEVAQGLKQKQRCLAGLEWDGCWRPPTAEEASVHFKVPERTCRNIWEARYLVMKQSRTCLQSSSTASLDERSRGFGSSGEQSLYTIQCIAVN